MNSASDQISLPSPPSMASEIKFSDYKFNGYPYLILALLERVPILRELSDDKVMSYHNSVRKILINKYKNDTVLVA